MSIINDKLMDYPFLKDMYTDDWFPNHLVDKGKAILIRLCEKIEKEKIDSLEGLYTLTHASTEEFNDLEEEFEDNESEIETLARESISDSFVAIAEAYGFEADREKLIAPRDW